jgi:hypothetical protein
MMADGARRVLTSSRYRWTILARFLAIVLLGIGLFAGVTFLACDRRLAVSYAQDLATLSRLQEQLPAIVMLTSAVQAAAVGGLMLLCALIWTHAVSGPLVRVSRALASLARGRSPEDIHFRKTDQLHGLADALREIRAAYHARREASRHALARADRLIEECVSLTAQGRATPALLAPRLTALRRIYEEMAEPAHHEGPG